MKRLRLGCIRVRWGSPWFGHVVGAAMPVVDRWLILFDPDTPVSVQLEVRRIMADLCAIRTAYQFSPPWRSNPRSLQAMLEAAEGFADGLGLKLDALIYPDEDEILPIDLADEMVGCWREGAQHILFPYLLTWDDIEHVRPVYDYMWAPHCKVLRWKRGMKFIPGYAGYCRPTDAYQGNSRRSQRPLRHTPFTTQTLRERRDRERARLRPWIYDEVGPPLAFDPAMTWAEYLKLSGERRKVAVH